MHAGATAAALLTSRRSASPVSLLRRAGGSCLAPAFSRSRWKWTGSEVYYMRGLGRRCSRTGILFTPFVKWHLTARSKIYSQLDRLNIARVIAVEKNEDKAADIIGVDRTTSLINSSQICWTWAGIKPEKIAWESLRCVVLLFLQYSTWFSRMASIHILTQ